MRIDPPRSLPTPHTDAPAPSSAPSPPDEPAGVRRGSYGLSVRPVTLLYDSNAIQYSGVLDTSSGIAPARRSRPTASPSSSAVRFCRRTTPPPSERPLTEQLSFTVIGTPSSGLVRASSFTACSSPPHAATRSSASAASPRAASNRSSTTALISGFTSRMRSTYARTSSTERSLPWRILSASSVAGSRSSSSRIAGKGSTRTGPASRARMGSSTRLTTRRISATSFSSSSIVTANGASATRTRYLRYNGFTYQLAEQVFWPSSTELRFYRILPAVYFATVPIEVRRRYAKGLALQAGAFQPPNAASSSRAMQSPSRSWYGAATTCIPIGSPFRSNPSGTWVAGRPSALNSIVYPTPIMWPNDS
uniref:Uncharacterized protein n=1 Tax=Anopheles coluzzii TaxID=1518534 RepID=A0A8W7PUS2_ANOCL